METSPPTIQICSGYRPPSPASDKEPPEGGTPNRPPVGPGEIHEPAAAAHSPDCFNTNLRAINLAFDGSFPKLSDRFSNYARELFQWNSGPGRAARQWPARPGAKSVVCVRADDSAGDRFLFHPHPSAAAKSVVCVRADDSAGDRFLFHPHPSAA